MAELTKKLNRQRGSYKAQLTRLHKAVLDVEEPVNVGMLDQRQQKLEEIYNGFGNVQLEIESLDDNPDNELEREEFEKNYYKCSDDIRKARSRLTTTSSHQNLSTMNVASTPSPSNGRSILPKIEIKPFDGNYAEWNSFYDMFRDLVHENESLPVVHKFHLLKSYLTGNASSVVTSVNASEENYTIAWELLQKKYNKVRKIVHSHIRALFELPEVPSNNTTVLSSLVDKVEMHVKALKSLGQPTEWHEMLIYIVGAKLDKNTRIHWERSIDEGVMPTLEQLLVFLEKFARDAEPVSLLVAKPTNTQREKSQFGKRGDRPRQAYVQVKEGVCCPICQKGHYIQYCEQFLGLEPRARVPEVKKARLCHNCFRSDHSTLQCRRANCTQCGKRHHVLLHFGNAGTENGAMTKAEEPPATGVRVNVSYMRSEVLLATVRIIVLDSNNKEEQCRGLLDPGAQFNFMTERLAKVLKLKLYTCEVSVLGVGAKGSSVQHYVKTRIRSRCSEYSETVMFLVLPVITGRLPACRVDPGKVPVPKKIRLADPEFYKSTEVDVLFGEYIYYRVLDVGQIRLPNKVSVLQKTRLGWVLSGRTSCAQSNANKPSCYLARLGLQENIARFWELEECPTQRYFSAEEKLCEQHYQQNSSRDGEGRYVVRLPFNGEVEKLGDSYQRALKRFYALERRLEGHKELYDQYKDFISEYVQLGHMSIIRNDTGKEGFYLPHHAVIKTTSNTTKLRVVFDASAKSTSGLSLNDTLLVGPTIQDDLFPLLVRFRLHNYVLTADIEKMFRQVKMHPEDTKFQKILWRDNKTQAVKAFRLNTVTYGTASAPFLAVRTLKQLAKDEGHAFSLAAGALESDFYMDDLLSGASTIDEAIQLREQLSSLLRLGGFNLRQWASNEQSLIEGFQDQASSNTVHFNASDTKKTLGICWNAKKDFISYVINTDSQKQRSTKRVILSRIAQLFDPLGLLGPVIVSAKFIMQELWKAKIDWDETVPQHIYTAWTELVEQLPTLNDFQISRRVLLDQIVDIQLHGFSDASEKGYGACIYFRSVDKAGRIATNLICAKSRVAPLKTISLPRLELCAALLLVRLYISTTKTLKIKFSKINFWSDSMITLHWLNAEPHVLKTFVANRVSEIQTHTVASDWSHVMSADNPADFISRGQLPKEFIKNSIWLFGPAWLSRAESVWPDTPLTPIPIPERRANIVLVSCKQIDKSDLFYKFSSFLKLQRVIAYCLRFRVLASKRGNCKGELTASELRVSHDVIIKMTQAQAFSRELAQLQSDKPLDASSKLVGLTPFLDTNGMLRVGGRLKNADIGYTQRHPILLPKSHPVTTLIIRYEHIRNLHAGTQATLNAVRLSYWPINGKNLTRFLVRNCLRCFKARPTNPPSYLMGDLPRDRLVAARPFENVGVDYCGPFFVKEKRFRNQKRLKVYVAVYICFLTKAVHLEVVSDLTTEAFMASLRRFFARRGKAKNIYSDNGTNFVGAKNELAELFDFLRCNENTEQMARYLNEQSISWHFSPPNSPHFGGLWEAAVKSFKYHLIRTVGDTLVTFEQFNSYVIEIEGVLNSRPLTSLSSDPNDLQPLTPAHFLIGGSLAAIPEHDFNDVPSNRLSLWQHIQKMKQHFWVRWHKEYINEIRIRSKWKQGTGEMLSVNDLVLIRDDGLPALRWPLGRVLEVHPGADGVTRVATVKTTSGIYKRSVKKLCPLPTELN